MDSQLGQRYGRTLRALREKSGLSQRGLARAVELNPTLVNRSESGERLPADSAEVERIVQALGLGQKDHDELLQSAGLWPLAFTTLGPSDVSLRALAEALTSPDLSPETKRGVRDAVAAIIRLASAAPTTRRRPAASPTQDQTIATPQ